MNYREVELLARKTYAADATEDIPLDMKDPISQIQITHEAYNTQAVAGTAHPVGCVTDITIKDGSDILYNLSGYQAVSADFYHNGKEPYNFITGLNNNNSETTYNLNFGRRLWDKELALDPSNFSNLQLSVSTDMNIGMVAPDAGYLTVTASLFDERKIEPVGFFTHKEHKAYTGGSATHERVNLPTDNAYRMMFFRCLKAGVGWDYLYDTIKLEEDNGKKIPFDLTNWEILRSILQRWPEYREWQIIPGNQTERYWYCTPTYWPRFATAGWTNTAGYYGSCYEGDGGRYKYISNLTGANMEVIVSGYLPHGTAVIPFGDQQDLDDWYEMEKVESLVVDILGKANMSSQTSEVFSQQFRRY